MSIIKQYKEIVITIEKIKYSFLPRLNQLDIKYKNLKIITKLILGLFNLYSFINAFYMCVSVCVTKVGRIVSLLGDFKIYILK